MERFAPTSTPRVGSSAMSKLGVRSSDRANNTFCWLPPDRAETGVSGVSGLTPIVEMISRTCCDSALVRMTLRVAAATVGFVRPVDPSCDLAASGAHQARQHDDLPGFHIERHVLEYASTSQVLYQKDSPSLLGRRALSWEARIERPSDHVRDKGGTGRVDAIDCPNYLSIPHDRDAVRDGENLVQEVGNEDDRGSGGGQSTDDAIKDLGLG